MMAANYYIDRNSLSARDENPGTEKLPWKTIAKANQTLNAGDTVFIKQGAYDNCIAPQRSGTASARIIYRNYQSDVVIIPCITDGISLSGRSYITVQGINFFSLYRFLWLKNSSHHNIIAYCRFEQGSGAGAWSGSRIYQSSQYNRIHHCRFSKYGYYDVDDHGCVMDIGSEEDRSDHTAYNLIEDSIFYHGGHHVLGVFGKYNVIRRNYFHNEAWAWGTADSERGAILYGNRDLAFGGYAGNSGRNLFENNDVAYSADPSDNNGASGMALNSSYNIVRFNRYYHNIGAGLSLSLTSSYLQDILGNRVYNNTFFHNGFNPEDPTDHMSSGLGFGIYSGNLEIKSNFFINNLFYRHRVPIDEYNIRTIDRKGLLALQTFSHNWDGDTQGDPRFIEASTDLSDPLKAVPPDLCIGTDSPCRDRGGYLTTVQSASGRGASFRVGDAGYFMDGWGICGLLGDEIQLLGTNQRARITLVNYETNTISIDRTVFFTLNQGIALSYEGAAPDIGAYEIGKSTSFLPVIRMDRTERKGQ